MKLRLVDQTTHVITRAEIKNGRLEIDFTDKTAEEVEAICSVPANFAEIELLTDSDEVFSDGIRGWTVYGGTLLLNDVKTAIMTKAPNVTEERLTTAEANALAARTATQEQGQEIEQANTNLQMAIAELTMVIATLAAPAVDVEGGEESV